MSVGGQFNVSPSGAATYSVPVSVPPGVAGLEPKLALTYNNQAGNGLLGMGWSLSGLSAITRCPQTKLQDGVNAVMGVSYTSTDRYCLDGQRLIAVANGVDGANGTEYRTEQDGYAKIISYADASATNGPSSFIVKTKSGLTMEFGKQNPAASSNSARIFAAGTTTVAVWALNRVIDAKNNYYTITYTVDAANGQYYPSRIDYDANDAQSLTASNAIIFSYDTRSDVSVGYRAGSVSKLTVRLKNIVASYKGSTASQFNIAYKNTGTVGSSAVSSITRCDASGNCLPATTFTSADYVISSTELNVAFPALPDWGYADRRWWNDMNGDGLADYCRAVGDTSGANSYLTCNMSNGQGGFTNQTFASLPEWGYSDRRWWIDVTGDGIVDYCRAVGDTSGNGSYLACNISDGQGGFTKQTSASLPEWGYSDRRWWIDVTGDGIADYCRGVGDTSGSGSYMDCNISDGQGGFTKQVFASLPDWGYADRRWWIDVNGDGIADFCRANGNTSGSGSYMTCSISDGQGNFSKQVSTALGDWGFSDRRWWVDVNGDGLQDYCRASGADSGSGSYLACNISDGAGGFLTTVMSAMPNWGYSDRRWWADINGDGIQDFCRAIGADSGSGSWMSCFLGMGDGTFTERVTILLPNWGYSDRRWWVDINGDGLPDFCRAVGSDSGSGSYLACSTMLPASYHEYVTSVNSVGSTLNVAYKKGTQTPGGIVLGNGAVSSYPNMYIRAGLGLVYTVGSNNGVGGVRTTNYSYGNLLTSIGLNGRGMLGFQWTQSQDAATGLTSRTCYRQDWPYIGLVDKVMTATSSTGLPACTTSVGYNDLSPLTASGSTLLSLTRNAYKFNAYTASDTAYASPVTCADDPSTGRTSTSCPASATAAGNRYQVYAFQSLAQSRDWDGSTFIALPATRTTMTQDNLGNATQVKAETLNADGTTPSGYSKTTTNTYMAADTANWLLGRLQKSSVQAVSP